jgi:hypothetical protein
LEDYFKKEIVWELIVARAAHFSDDLWQDKDRVNLIICEPYGSPIELSVGVETAGGRFHTLIGGGGSTLSP